MALLSNGTEAGKGPSEVVEAHARLLAATTGLNFIGNVEGVDIPRGTADVVVCRGFVGNVVLKMLEGVAETVLRAGPLRLQGEAAVARGARPCSRGGIERLKDLTDWEQYGGAPLLGFDQPVHQGARPLAARGDRQRGSRSRPRRRPALVAEHRSGAAMLPSAPAAAPPGARLSGVPTAPRPRSTAGISTRPTCGPSSTACAACCARRSRRRATSAPCPGAAGAAARAAQRAGGAARADLHHLGQPAADAHGARARSCALDGVEFDEFVLKHNLRNLLRGRFRALREQVGYKLPALLAGRAGVRRRRRETLFGDDAEADAFIYSLYADLLRRARRPRRCSSRSSTPPRVYPTTRARTVALCEALPRGECGAAASSSTSTGARRRARFDRYGARLVPIYNYFQAALVLLRRRPARRRRGAARGAARCSTSFDYTLEALRNSLQDLLRRGRLRRETPTALARHVAEGLDRFGALGAAPASRDVLSRFASRLDALSAAAGSALHSVPLEAPIDYLAAFAEDVPRRHARR